MSLRGQGSIPNFGDCAVGSGPSRMTLISAERPVYIWQHRLTERNPTGTELKIVSKYSANGSGVVRYNDPRSWQLSKQRRIRHRVTPAIPSYLSISHRATLTRLPCGSLRSALPGTCRDAGNQF